MQVKVGSQPQIMRLWMSTIESQMSIVLADTDAEVFRGCSKFELEKSSSANVIEKGVHEDLLEPDDNNEVTPMSMTG